MSTDQAIVILVGDVRGLHVPLFSLNRDVPPLDVAAFLDAVDGEHLVAIV